MAMQRHGVPSVPLGLHLQPMARGKYNVSDRREPFSSSPLGKWGS